ncbi:hypothetical protein FQN57_000830 [Myotisia sp. PD_48]|nr:hypothetical protein FQN57_000830 [Myotisia sp. PD_48]
MAGDRDQIPGIYKQAIRKFEEITKQNLDDPALLRLNTIDDLMKEIDYRNDKFSEFRETRHLFFDTLQGALMPVELIGNLASGAASMAFPPSTLVFGAFSYLMNAAKGVSASYDAIQDLLESLKALRLKVYSKELISDELSDQLSEILVTLIEIFALSRKAIKGGRFLKFTRNVLIGTDDKMQAAVGKLAKLTEIEGHLVGAETLTETKKVGRAVDDITIVLQETNMTANETGVTVGQISIEVTELNTKFNSLMQVIKDTADDDVSKQGRSHEDLVKKVLQPSVTAQDFFDSINKSRVPGTGDWVRSEELFKSWHGTGPPILWVSGNPGAGKSYLSSNIISFLRDQHPQGVQHPSHTSVGYFFFKDDNPKTRSFHLALRDLAYQISQNDPLYAKYLTTNCTSPDDVATLSSAWRHLFIDFYAKSAGSDSSVFLVFDGVDEAFDEGRQEFFSLLQDINSGDNSRIRITLVGRPQLGDSISEALEADIPTIHVTSEKNSPDIVRYIESSIRKSNTLKRASAKLRSEIIEKLSAGAQGMFIWVDLMLKELLRKRSESTMRKSLQEAPKGLNEMLRHVLESFSSSLTEEEAENLNELLAWTTCAQRPLSLGELDTILKLKSEEGDGMIYLEGALRRQFASFFGLTREDGLTTSDMHLVRHLDVDSDDDERTGGPRAGEMFEDTDDMTDFDSNPTTTEVSLCHASIGDFLRDEQHGKISAGSNFPAVGVNIIEAEFSVLKTCLQLLCDEELAKKPQGNSQSMHSYALNNWLGHIQDVEPSKLDKSQRGEIVTLLAEMFENETCMKRWAGGMTNDFFNKNLTNIRKWLDDKEVVPLLPEKSQEFLLGTSEVPARIFKPVALFVAKQWLQDVWWIPRICCQIVHSYIALENGNSIAHRCLDSAEDIISVAEWSALEKNAQWHRRLAMALREGSHYDQALEHFGKALELDSTMSAARGGMAIVYLMKKEYEKAIELDKVTQEEIPLTYDPANLTPNSENYHDPLERMAQCYDVLKDDENAFKCYQQAQRVRPSCNTCTLNILSKMDEMELYGDIIQLLKDMNAKENATKANSVLIDSLWQNSSEEPEYFGIVAKAAHKTNELNFVADVYRSAIRAARKKLKTVVACSLELCLAALYYQHFHEENRAIPVWKKVLETFSVSKEESEMGFIRKQASIKLARHYFREAVAAGIDSPEAVKHVAELEWLVNGRGNGESNASFIPASASATILGAWYILKGMKEEANVFFKPSIKAALEILSDDDPENDMEGYFGLVSVLIVTRDDRNAIALLHALGAYENKTSANTDEESGSDGGEDDSDASDSKYDDDYFACACDGSCNRVFKTYDSTYLCRYCFDLLFCEPCMKLLKANQMPLNLCSPHHDWLFVPPNPQGVHKGKIFIDGAFIDLEQWKKNIKLEWKV